MIVVFAGRRAQSLPGGGARVAPRLRRLLRALQPRVLIGAAADGADLLVLEAVLGSAAAPTIHLTLPTSLETFADASVAPEWRERHRRALAAVAKQGGTVVTLDEVDGKDAYLAANERFLDRADQLRQVDEGIVILAVGAPGEGAVLTDLISSAELRRHPVLRVDPTIDIADRPTCFVAMPYHRKLDPQRSIQLDCELTYNKIIVPALESAQLRYRRGDEEIDSGIVLAPMIEWLADADLVIADLATGNFNVGWELGLRHLLREHRTLLMVPETTVAPFDVSALRHVAYNIDEAGITDADAIAAWARLAPYLDETATGAPARADSLVAAVMGVTAWAQVAARSAREERFDELREQLALARDLQDARLMEATAKAADELSVAAARIVRAEAGVGLVRLKRYDKARELLAPLVAADQEVLRPEAHTYYAQTLYRPDSATVADYDNATTVLNAVLAKRPGHAEVRAAIGAVAKRRAQRHAEPTAQVQDLGIALRAYAYDHERDLDAFYEGINVVACGTVLELVHGDAIAGAQARRLVDTVRLAAELKLQRDSRNFWAAATVAEADLYRHLLGLAVNAGASAAGYAAARRLARGEGDLHSSAGQLRWLQDLGLEDPALVAAQAALGGTT
jgi:hypothetical protein